MGLIEKLFNGLFGSGNLVKETAEVFRENREAAAVREVQSRDAALQQFAAEFEAMGDTRSRYDRFIDGLNRLPRPALAFGTLGLFVAAMIDPIWFASRMTGIALVPEPLWWLLGAIVSFYFGARHQFKGQEFQRSLAQTLSRVPQVLAHQAELAALRSDSPGVADSRTDMRLGRAALNPSANAALEAWRRAKRTS